MSHSKNISNPNEEISCRSEATEAPENKPVSPSTESPLEDVADAGCSRRDALKGALGVGAMAALGSGALLSAGAREARAETSCKRLAGKRILITQADHYMGPDYIKVFTEEGAEVIADTTDLRKPGACEKVIADAGHIDVLVANLAADARFGVSALDTDDEVWAEMFDIMVHPLHRLSRAVLPQMLERKKGKILVIGSATGVKGMAGVVAYAAARHAQVGYIRSLALEIGKSNVQINLIAQNWVENPEYFPPEFIKTPEFQEVFKSVPFPRLATGREDALFGVFLASDESDFFVGQAIPFSGGWAQ